ncbi:alpha/beta fold hydrolase [Streptomyces sp. Tu102]|uniref:alpha/beta fold hydrolase n=1 Tax=Streptomyces sp. Tu102 TaxID=2838019 RepID=UPI001BDD8FE3|nr:alpha/beta hydrolase [Streptomyces sp. Tu102]MBT1093391.1 alpha/beta fold hydrolase [Streptomyces sp. Tu102]
MSPVPANAHRPQARLGAIRTSHLLQLGSGPIRPSSTERSRSRNARPPAPPCEPATGPQAWRLSRHNLIGGADRIIPPATQEFMALRSGVKTQIVEGASHMVFVSRPGATAAPSGPGTKPSNERRR